MQCYAFIEDHTSQLFYYYLFIYLLLSIIPRHHAIKYKSKPESDSNAISHCYTLPHPPHWKTEIPLCNKVSGTIISTV